jgi:hypothetical protein
LLRRAVQSRTVGRLELRPILAVVVPNPLQLQELTQRQGGEQMKEKKTYEAPEVTDLGTLAEMTQNGFSQGNDVGDGKSGS